MSNKATTSVESADSDYDTSLSFEELKRFFEEQSDDPLLNLLKHQVQEIVKQALDSSRVFTKGKCTFHPFVGLQYPNSPTARLFLNAFKHFYQARYLLEEYKKDTVKNEKDCEYLRAVFENIVHGHICENSIFSILESTEQIFKLTNQYLNFHPNDVFAEYVQVILLFRRQFSTHVNQRLANYESERIYIRTAERLCAKLTVAKKLSGIHNKVLKDLLYYLGAKYVTTKQPARALYSFQRCYDLDHENEYALYGIAYHYMETDPSKAISLFKEFIKMAPVCHKQYPKAYYMLAMLFVKQGNLDMAFYYCDLAEEAEKKRLPFLDSVDVHAKTMLQTLKYIGLKSEAGLVRNAMQLELD